MRRMKFECGINFFNVFIVKLYNLLFTSLDTRIILSLT